MSSAGGLWLVAGLGNPGTAYLRTRHNIGWLALDGLAAGRDFRPQSRFHGSLVRVEDALLLKPETFMNLSGQAVRAVADFHKIPAERILVVLDEAALDFGRLRLRRQGSGGGHNGLLSVIEHLGTQSFPRLRLGIGAPPTPVSLHDHVLGRFTPAETEALPAFLARAVEAIDCVVKNGLACAMNRFNTAGL